MITKFPFYNIQKKELTIFLWDQRSTLDKKVGVYSTCAHYHKACQFTTNNQTLDDSDEHKHMHNKLLQVVYTPR